jgi:hypothetical protein
MMMPLTQQDGLDLGDSVYVHEPGRYQHGVYGSNFPGQQCKGIL